MGKSKKSTTTTTTSSTTTFVFPREAMRLRAKKVSVADFEFFASVVCTNISWSDLIKRGQSQGSSMGWGKIANIVEFVYEQNKAQAIPMAKWAYVLMMTQFSGTRVADKIDQGRMDRLMEMGEGKYTIAETTTTTTTKGKKVRAADMVVSVDSFEAMVAAQKAKAKEPSEPPTEPANTRGEEQQTVAPIQRTVQETIDLMNAINGMGLNQKDTKAMLEKYGL